MPTSPQNLTLLGFSMREEAKNTASHRTDWRTSGDAKLRFKPVAFVSAGVVEPLKDEDLSGKPSDPKGPEALAEVAVEECAEVLDDIEDTTAAEFVAEEVLEAIGDTIAAADIDTLETEPASVISVETTIETVKEEITVAIPASEDKYEPIDQPTEAQQIETKDLFFIDLGDEEDEEGNATLTVNLPPPKISSPRSSAGQSDSSEEIILFRGRAGNVRELPQKFELPRRAAPARPSAPRVESKPAPEADGPSKQLEPATVASAPQAPKSRSRSRQKRPEQKKQAHSIEEGDEDNEEDAILADYIANMAANPDDDFFASHLQSISNQRDLGGDHHAVNLGSAEETSDQEGQESEGLGLSDAEEDDLDLFNKDDDGGDMDADIDDETFARLLAKQEELGLDADDLVLFSGSYAQTGTRKASGKRPADRPSAMEVADAFDSLGLDDWAHLTGQQPRKRHSKRPPNFNVDDPDMEAALRAAWQGDRERKKTRKLERESLRAEGLLGKNANPEDMRVRYLSGMKLDDFKTELISFLLSSDERFILHELANKFNIKSQSTGKGDQRRPVLYRTKRTLRFTPSEAQAHVQGASDRIHRKYFHRLDNKFTNKGPGAPRTSGGATGGFKALVLREGEVVGASVPELGAENKGRNMLEKMGWSKGMALGAMDNKGILEPVAQVMKRGKAGLG
ncbi:squalene synthetase-like protein [Collariella sp. IMI 366227]|nr:squalene synthetase-like protein [Collariella sp. IMI 366227]